MTSKANNDTFSFDDVLMDDFKSVRDVRVGDKVVPYALDNGQVIEKKDIDFSKGEEQPNIKTVFFIHCELNGEKCKLKLSRKAIGRLRTVCDSNPTALAGKQFSVDIEGTGNFAYITLIYKGN